MNCTQKQQLVCFPKVRVYKPWFRHFNDHKDFRNEGTVHLFSLMALFSYANFRSNERVIYGDRYMEAPGQWICKLGALPRILRVHSKAQALELMEYFRNHGFLTFEILDEEKEILRFTIADWKEHCTHLQYNYYSYKGSGFFFFPLPVGRLLLKTARKEVGIVFSELDAIMDMWLHTILNDPQVRGSEYMPVVYYSNMRGMPLLSYTYLARRWGWSKSRVGRFMLKAGEYGIISRVSFSSSRGSVISMCRYALDTTPVNACVKDSETTTVEITNQRMASIMIHKIDAATGTGIYGVKFVLYDSGKNPIGEYTTDQDGYIYIDDELVPGKYYLRELEAADGYIRDEQYKTVYVERGKCAQIEWENSAVTGQIQIRKYSSEDNTVTGQLAGTPLEGAVFEITQARSGKVVGYIVTDARGVAASGPLPLGRYFVTEVSAPKYYQLSGEKMEAEIEYPSQIIKLSAYNKPASLGVTIKKSGNYEVQSGQSMSYDFSGIANTSNVALNHFFWHDRIPTDATRALSISTGTYNARLYYKVTFKTNLNDYRTLASNLLTSNNYSLSLNAATLRLAQGEYVTDVRFEFGTVPSGFSSVVKPTMRVQVLGTVSNGYQIINRADVGGQYLNEWQTAKTTWVTTVRRFNTTPLPKTGY